MFTRFKATPSRLQVSLRESRRVAGKVCSEHIASLGSIALPMTISGRVAFWTALHERLAKLANRVNGADQGKIIRDAVHARIPMVTADEHEAERRRKIEAEVAEWKTIEGFYDRIISGDENRIAECYEEIERHRANKRDVFLPLKDGITAAATQHRGALEAGNEAASRAFVEERKISNIQLGSILGKRIRS